MRTKEMVCRFRVGVVALVAVWVTAQPATAQVHIEDLRIGFGLQSISKDGNYKIGSWAPVRVRIRAEKTGFDGILELSTQDSDDLETAFHRPVHVEPNDSIDVPTFVKPGKSMPDIAVRLIDRDGRTRARVLYDQLPDGAKHGELLIVALGHPAGLDPEQLAKRHGSSPEQFRVAQLETARELPARWFGYEALDHLILCTNRPEELEKLDPALQEALREWVRHGGHLVVSVGTSWQRVTASFLGSSGMLPADIDGTETVRQLRELETYGGSSAAINLKDPLIVPRLTNLRGRLLIGTNELPLAVQAPYGFGTVTLVALELSEKPFATWENRNDFWLKLLTVPKPTVQDSQPQVRWNQMPRSDLSSHLRLQLEQFQGISLVPFQWVAFFIFLYILLIGPVDYLLVKKVFKRMELTWVTFPAMVIAVSVAAYFTAYWLKGDELRINKVDVVDVDQASGALRGTTWFTLFSPRIENYTVGIERDFCAAPQPATQMSVPPVVVSWLGLAEDALGGMGRHGGVGLFRRGYRFGPDAQSLVDVPVQVWSMKGFTARWHGRAVPTIEASLQGYGDRVRGTLTNRLPVPLQDCVVAFRGKAYQLGDLSTNMSVELGSRTYEDLRGYLSRRATNFTAAQALQYARYYGNQPTTQFSPNDLIVTMMFHDRLPGEGNQYAANNYFADLDLSEHLDHSRAILVARVPATGSKLILNEREVTQNISTATYLRVVIPVTSSTAEPEPPAGGADR